MQGKRIAEKQRIAPDSPDSAVKGEDMSKAVQKLDRKKSEIYKDAPVAKFGEREA